MWSKTFLDLLHEYQLVVNPIRLGGGTALFPSDGSDVPLDVTLVGYARVLTEQQDLTAQRNGPHAVRIGDDRIDVDHGLTGTNCECPGLRLALSAGRDGDTLVVTKLDRLARSLPDARDILDELTRHNVKLTLGGSSHDPTDPVGRLLSIVLAMVAKFESDLVRLRTKEGMKVAKAKGR
jgi:DNA invertase Pin-like site-specific DNA recombinase